MRALSSGSLRSLRCSPGNRRLRRIRRSDRVGRSDLFSISFVGSSCRSAARTSRARIALCSRLLRRHSGDQKRVPSLLLSTAPRDPYHLATSRRMGWTATSASVAGLLGASLENRGYDRMFLAGPPTWLIGVHLMPTVSNDSPCVRIHVVHELFLLVAGSRQENSRTSNYLLPTY
jgi:hypothetical protein